MAVTALLAYSYLLYSLGPILAYARHDLHLSYLQVSSHTALWAAGTIATGATHRRLVRRFGRWRVGCLSAALTAVGATALASATAPVITLAGAAVAGAAGTQLQAAAFAELAEKDARGASALLPSSLAAAAALAVAVPFLLIASRATIGWRAAALVPVPVLTLVALAALPGGRARPTPPPRALAGTEQKRPGRQGLPALEACLAGLAVAIEFAVVFLGPQLLYGGQGRSLRATVDALVWLYGGQLIARAAGPWLAGRVAPRRVFFLSLALAAAGFSGLWSGQGSVRVEIGLALMGIGVGNLYPTALALALRESTVADAATGAVQFSAGIAVLLSQLAVGGLAEAIGIVHAFAVEPVLMAAAALLAARTRPSAP
jgi:MFS family permease